MGQFDVEAALRRHLVRQLTDKLAATASNRPTTQPVVVLVSFELDKPKYRGLRAL